MSMTTNVAMGQSTSLVIDNQTPGWLSSKINYGDQLSVERLKVTGYINGEDLLFIKKLKEDFNLKILDLSESSIVSGGTEYQTSDDNFSCSSLKGSRKLTKLITPLSAKGTIYPVADSIICCGTETSYYNVKLTEHSTSTRTPTPNYKFIQFSENAQNLYFYPENYYSYIYKDGYTYYTGTLALPKTINYIEKLYLDGGTIISFVENPETITIVESDIKGGILYVPIGTKSLYEYSSFNKMTIIEMAPPTSISLGHNNLKMYKGDSFLLDAVIEPEYSYYKGVKWNSSDENVVIVDQSGKMDAIGAGEAKVSVCSDKNQMVSDTCIVNVYEHTTGIMFLQSQKEINIGETCKLTSNTLPLGTSDNEISWSSSDPTTASVDDLGNVTALKTGICIIKATSVDGNYTAECTVTIVQPATNVTLNKHEISILVNNNEVLTAAIIPDNTTNKEIIWTSNNTEVADVNNDGIVTAKKAGSAKIYATALSNPEAKDSCNVSVLQPATGITLEETSWTIGELGVTKQLVARVMPEDASNKSIVWISSNNSVCTVSSSGVVTSSGYGNAIVIATTTDGGYVATCTVTVYQPVTITATNCSRAYGEENPVFDYTSEGGTLNGTPEISCEATKTSPVGTYPIMISKGSVTNLGDTYVNGTLTITPAPLTISAGNYTKRQGEENPQFTASYEGFKNDESNDVLTKQPTISTSVTKETAPGEYPVVISGAEAQNYSISFINGILKVLEANAIIIKADNKTISYGDAIPELTYTVEGAELQGTPSITCDATSQSSVGTYPIIISKGSVANYNDTYVNGTLTIEKAPLTVSVGDYVKHQGEDNPIFNLTYDGFRNEDGLSSLITIPQATTDATKDSPDGTYDIIISGGNAVNYYFKYVNGTLTVLPTSSGINSVYENMNLDDVTIYAPNGTRRSALQRGINILKMSDGTTRKVIVK